MPYILDRYMLYRSAKCVNVNIRQVINGRIKIIVTFRFLLIPDLFIDILVFI